MTFGEFICESLIRKGTLPEGYRYMEGCDYHDEGFRSDLLSIKNEYNISFILDSTFKIITITIPQDLYIILQRHYKLSVII